MGPLTTFFYNKLLNQQFYQTCVSYEELLSNIYNPTHHEKDSKQSVKEIFTSYKRWYSQSSTRNDKYHVTQTTNIKLLWESLGELIQTVYDMFIKKFQLIFINSPK